MYVEKEEKVPKAKANWGTIQRVTFQYSAHKMAAKNKY